MSFLIVLFLIIGQVFSQTSTVQEREVLRQKISNAKCAQSPEKYQACMSAVDAVSFRASGVHVVPKGFKWK